MMTGRKESSRPPTTRRVRNFEPRTPSRRSANKLQKVAGQNESQGHEQQKNQDGKSGKKQKRKALLNVGVENVQIQRRLGKKDPERHSDPDRQQDNGFLAAGCFLVAGWIGSSHFTDRPGGARTPFFEPECLIISLVPGV